MEKIYRVEIVAFTRNLEDKLNEFYEQGWETISVTASTATARYRVILKKREN